MKHEIFADVKEDGTLSTGKRLEARRAFQSFAGKRVRVTIERAYNKRSSNQNRFFHGVCLPLIGEALLELGYNEGRNMELVKDFVKVNLLTTEMPDKHGEVRKFVRPTSGLSTSEFMDLISDLQQWAAEYLGIIIPDPNSQSALFS